MFKSNRIINIEVVNVSYKIINTQFSFSFKQVKMYLFLAKDTDLLN